MHGTALRKIDVCTLVKGSFKVTRLLDLGFHLERKAVNIGIIIAPFLWMDQR